MARWGGRLILGGLALVFLLSGLYQAAHDSPTVDEAVDIASGVTSLARHDLRLNPEHDLLVHVLSAGPALLAHPVIPDGPGYRSGDWFDHTDEFVRANRAAGKLDRVVFLARLVPLVEGLLVALALYVLTDRLLGGTPAVFATGLWLSTPVFVGFSHVVSLDITFTMTVLGLCLALANDHQRVSGRSSIIVGAALGAALLARHSGLVLVPAVAVSAVASRWGAGRRTSVEAVLCAWVTAWVAVWSAFVVFGSSIDVFGPSRFDGLIGQQRSQSALVRLALAVPWPKAWAGGLAYLASTSTARPAYLFGHSWVGGRWWFFPGSLLVKAPLGLVAVLALLPIGCWRVEPSVRRRLAAVLAPAAAALVLQLLLQPLDLGLRYSIPVVAIGIVAAASITLWFRGRPALVGAAGLAATQLAAMIVATPHSIAWTPPPFTAGYRWASDSNIDYGQDERAVEHWAAGKYPAVALLLPRGTDIPPGSKRLLGSDPATVRGWVAVSATRLTVLNRDELSWLRGYCPIGTINGSVLVYRFDGPPDTTPGSAMPAGVCHTEYSRRV